MRGHLVLLLDGVMEMCWILSHMVIGHGNCKNIQKQWESPIIAIDGIMG